MKPIYQRFAAALCTAALLPGLAFSVSGAEANDPVLPSGFTVSMFRETMESLAARKPKEARSFASAAVGVFRGDEILYSGYFGEIDFDRKIPADENTVYEWGSISKTFVWVSVMQLYEQGKLDLDADIRGYLPDGFFQNLTYDDPITMLHLMTHRAGWQETTRPMSVRDQADILPLADVLRAVEPAQVSRPGDVCAYSNYGAALAGYIVERVSGEDYCGYVHTHILDPLGMTRTAINPAHTDNAWVEAQRRQLRCYQIVQKPAMELHLGSRLEYIMPYPAGAAAGTLTDLMKFAQALCDDSAPLFQNPETQRLMFSGTDFCGDSDIPTNCHGFWCDEFAVRTVGHSGATNAGQANMLIDRESGTGLVILTNEPAGNLFLSAAPTFAFGELPAGKYGSASGSAGLRNGYYLPSRSIHRGMMKLFAALTPIRLNNLEDADSLGNGVVQIRTPSMLNPESEAAFLLGRKDAETITQPSVEAKYDPFYLCKLMLLAAFILTAIAAGYMLRIRHLLRRTGRLRAVQGGIAVTAGQTACLVSALTCLCMSGLFAASAGLSPAVRTVIGIVQMLCAAVCAVSAGWLLVNAFRKMPKAPRHRYFLAAAGNLITLTCILFFEMYRFWGN